jgi:hypothetical protein
MMRSFWGLVLLVIGLLFLAINFGWVEPEIWNHIWRLWPLLLIAIGLRSILRNDAAYIFALIVLLAVGTLIATLLPSRSLPPLSSRFERIERDFKWSLKGETLSGEQATFNQAISPESTLANVEIDLGGYYDIAIIGGDTNTVAVDFKGPKELIERLAFTGTDTTTVGFGDTGSGRDMHWFFRDDQKVTGTITIPRAVATKLELSGLSTINLNGLQGKLTIDASGASQITSENSTIIDPKIDLSGAGKAILGACSGTGDLDLSGAGKIDLSSCALDALTVKASGAGDVTVRGSLKDLDADVSGAAKVKVPQPSGVTKQDVSGVGKLDFQ